MCNSVEVLGLHLSNKPVAAGVGCPFRIRRGPGLELSTMAQLMLVSDFGQGVLLIVLAQR